MIKLTLVLNKNMKLTAQHIKKAAGFTLIELLVVIAIIGILAAALIATIDPLEQIKKSRDTTTKNVAVEYLSALTRYYATHQDWPWVYDADDDGSPDCGTTPDGSTTIADLSDCTTVLTEENELKDAFTTSNALKDVNVNYDSGDEVITVCFAPESKSQQADKQTAFDEEGNSGTTHWCTK
jgi:prepilin-type N-terminal cleavage/methylation domain-containing protein